MFSMVDWYLSHNQIPPHTRTIYALLHVIKYTVPTNHTELNRAI